MMSVEAKPLPTLPRIADDHPHTFGSLNFVYLGDSTNESNAIAVRHAEIDQQQIIACDSDALFFLGERRKAVKHEALLGKDFRNQG